MRKSQAVPRTFQLLLGAPSSRSPHGNYIRPLLFPPPARPHADSFIPLLASGHLLLRYAASLLGADVKYENGLIHI